MGEKNISMAPFPTLRSGSRDSGATALRVSRRKVEEVAERTASELAGVAPETVPRGTRKTCHAEPMMVPQLAGFDRGRPEKVDERQLLALWRG